MATTNAPVTDESTVKDKPAPMGRWIALGLVAGVICGLLFGEYCAFLQSLGRAYVGLLQMTVLPYLVLSLISKMGRLSADQARQLGFVVVVVLLLFWVIGVLLVISVSWILPTIPGASFYSPEAGQEVASPESLLSSFIPVNVFRSLSDGLVPGVVVFCLFFGVALIPLSGKEPILDFLDLCAATIGRINVLLVRLSPFGLFALTAAAAGTLRVDELSRLQGYLVMFTLACLAAAYGLLPMLVGALTDIRYRAVVRAAHEPVLTAIATGKLFVVLPQIVDKCEELLTENDQADAATSELGESTANILVPLAYPFPHIGKVLAFVFISFAAWYVGRGLTLPQTAAMASTGVVSSFASPLISIPYLLDAYRLPQDLMPLFILPGFITTRLADVVGVFHLMALTLIVSCALQGRLRIQWVRVGKGMLIVGTMIILGGLAGRWYLARTTLEYNLDKKLLALEIPNPYGNVVVYRTTDEVPERLAEAESTLERVRASGALRVGYHPDHLPYSFFNSKDDLVGVDVELMHRLAEHLEVRLEFVPFVVGRIDEQLENGEFDVVIGGLIMNIDRLARAEFTEPYQLATFGIVLRDHRRMEFDTWDDPQMPADVQLAVCEPDLLGPAQRHLPHVEIVKIDSVKDFFEGRHPELDGLIIPAEEGSAWNVLYPSFSVVIPQPIVQRPVAMAARLNDASWIRFLDRWLDFERLDGSFDRLQRYWIEGQGTKQQAPRWSVLQDVLHWLP